MSHKEFENSSENNITSDFEFIIPSPDRWPEYKAMRLQALKEEPQAFAVPYKEELDAPDQKWIDRLKPSNDPADIRLVVESQNQMIGMVSSFRHKEKVDTAVIVNVYISNKYRGKGLGKKMIQELVGRLREVENVKKIELSVNVKQSAAIHTYESLGFQITGTENVVMGDGKSYDEYLMDKITKRSE